MCAQSAISTEIIAMPKLTLDIEALRVESLATAMPEPLALDVAATANTCYRSCLNTACFC